MINKIKKHIRARAAAGFTLIETLVAVLILSTAIAGPLTIASRGLTAALVAKDQVTAFYLAQDAVEYVRYKRDTACLAAGVSPCDPSVWLSSLSACTSAKGCYLDSTENNPTTPTACSVTTGCISSTFASSKFLYYNPTTNLYTYSTSGTTKQPFARSVVITSVSSNEAKLVVTVSWIDTDNIVRSVVVTEELFNWE
jgi:prepilin-type N-terminal cleavage/methylation domain-containing protein